MSASTSQPLPPRESALLKKLLRFSEMKQFKQGLRTAKAILSVYPNHGETMAMKGLVLSGMGKKEEAFELAKAGLRNDIKSHVCWHVLGLLHRSDKNYVEAIKAYRQAHRIDKDNINILRDLSVLQLQMNDLEGFKVTRQQLLAARSDQRQSWIGLAIANHLLNDFDSAENLLSTFEENEDERTKEEEFVEYSELIMYKAEILEESKQYEACLNYVNSKEKFVSDKRALQELKVRLFLHLGKLEEAKKLLYFLLSINVENRWYYTALEQASGFSASTPFAERVKLYDDILAKSPRAQMPVFLPMTFATGAEFAARIEAYLRKGLSKGVIPLFKTVRTLLNDPAKAATIESLVLGFEDSLAKSGKFAAADEAAQLPTCIVWTRFFVAQLLDTKGKLQEALTCINKAIEHTPTMIELYMCKAKIYKHAGDAEEAAHWMNFARELDLADRYINNKCVKYMLRAGRIKEAEETVSLFTKEAADPIGQLTEMQCLWFELEHARAFLAQKNKGMALKKLHNIDRHYMMYSEDAYEFTLYCTRKMTLRSFVRCIRMQDQIRDAKYYHAAAVTAIGMYLDLVDKPLAENGGVAEDDPATANMTEAERKKYLSKQRKAAKKAEAEAAQQEAKKPVPPPKKDGEKVDDDPDGKKLLSTATPLDEAAKFVKTLQHVSKTFIEGHLVSYEVHRRKNKVLLMLQALKRAAAIDANNAVYRGQLAHFVATQSTRTDLAAPVKTVVADELKTLLNGKAQTPVAIVTESLDKHKNEIGNVLPLARALVQLNAGDKANALARVTSAFNASLESITVVDKAARVVIRNLQDALQTLPEFGASEADVKALRAKCAARLPLHAAFNDKPTASRVIVNPAANAADV
eukprot:m.179800 g.179800  ORF g.179800 m.179800 type:complete len:865 (-) comp17416_c0_seq3:198-2792(-)